jgi:mono/diheme cytochrome c family protein
MPPLAAYPSPAPCDGSANSSIPWAAAAAIAWRAAPHLDLLFVDAYPTSFYRSPTGFAATSIVAGQALYPQHCAACHGAEGRGDGPAAKRARIPPADLTAEHLWGHEDGELFWWLTDGIRSGEGERVMPGFGGVLSDEQRWALIDYVRARNAGLTEHATGTWTPPLRAPGFAAACAGGRSLDLAELRGRPVRIAFSAGSVAVDGCETDDPAVPAAYAVVTGQRPQALAGMVVLVDANGWLRGLFPAEDAARIAAAGQAIAANPLPEEAGAHRHRMAE